MACAIRRLGHNLRRRYLILLIKVCLITQEFLRSLLVRETHRRNRAWASSVFTVIALFWLVG